jgi:PAS domain S-box-containing protein
MSSAAQSMSFFMVICAVPIAGLAAYTYRQRDRPAATGLLLCLVGMAGWSVQLAIATWPTQLLPVYLNTTIRNFFQILVIFGWPLFAWEYINRERIQLSWPVAGALLVIPVLTIVLTATNPIHHLVIGAGTPANPIGISEFDLGPWYLVHIAYAVAFVMLPVGWLLSRFRTASGAHRKQLGLLLLGWTIGFPGALQTHLFRLIEWIPLYVDLTPLTFIVTSALWALALFRYQLFTMIPVSRRTVVETIPDPVITVDQHGAVVDINPAGRTLFETPAQLAGQPIEDLFAEYPSIVDFYEDGARDAEIEIETNGDTRQFSVTCERVRDGGQEAVIVLRDITPVREREQTLKQREQELTMLKQVFSRVFRHNIRNELTVVEGQLERIDHQTDDDVVADSIQTASEATGRLLGHAEKTRSIERVVDRSPEPLITSLATLVADAVSPYQSNDTDETVDVDVPDVPVAVIDGFELAIANIVENAIEHNPAPVTVSITATVTADTVELRIEDDGTGIPANETVFLEDGGITELNHGSGVGLWVVRWYVERADGSLSIEQTGDGTAVEITLDRAEAVPAE